MEALEMQETSFTDEDVDLCNYILSQYKNSKQEGHQHLCSVIGTMSQELKDQNIPLIPIAYFGATLSSLDRLLTNNEAASPVVEALITLLSIILPKISIPILRKKSEFVAEPIFRVLCSQSSPASTVIYGLKCVSHLICVGNKVNWTEVSQLYGIILDFVTDSRFKVRKQSHLCLQDVLQSFKRSAMLVPASEGISNTFERFLLLAGGSNTDASEGPKGAQEVLYILDSLKDCLPLMSLKYATSILKYFKSLLELCQPLVTRRIIDILHALCIYPTSEVAPEVLLDLFCSLASSASSEKSVDGMKFTARLLDVGIRKVYSLNRQICVVKLPLVFSSLGEILACEHEESLFAAMEALKSLINACIDVSLIKQGVDQIMMNADGETRRSGPTIIEKICSIIESLLGYRYNAVWDMSFQVVSAMFDILGKHSFYLLRGTLKSLVDMQKLPDEDLPYRKQLLESIGSSLGAMGPERFLSIVPLNLEAEHPSDATNVWLFPILKQYTVGASLSFFIKSVLSMVGWIRLKSRRLEQEGRIFSSRSTEALVYSLWSLFPSFCNYPVDTAESFKGLEKVLCSALREEPEVCALICSGLRILIQQNKRLLEEDTNLSDLEISISEQRARAYYIHQVAVDNLNILKSSAREILSVLSGMFLKSSKDNGGCLQCTIGEFASISEKAVVKRLFTVTMQKLLKVTQEAGKEQPRQTSSMQIDEPAKESSPSVARACLLDLAVSLLPGLDAKDVDLLFTAIKPALQDDDGMIQKKAYKILSIILKDREEFLKAKLDSLLDLMIEVLPSSHFSAKRHRLDCLYFLIIQVSKDASKQKKHNIICSFLTEIILALKEANKKTRNRAYEMLVQIGHAYGEEEIGGKKENLLKFFNMVAGGLAGETPHMISAAMKGLARLAYEFSDLVSAAYCVLPSAFLLLQRKNKEIIKASLGLVKVLVAKSQAECLQKHLKTMVEGLLKWEDDTKNHFKAKVKLLLEMLVKKCGLDAVKAVIPEEHMKLLTNIRKIKERKERKIAAYSEETGSIQSKATTSRLSRWNHTKIFSDFGDGTENSDSEYMGTGIVSDRRSKSQSWFNSNSSSLRSKHTRQAAKSLPEDLFHQMEDGPLDLLDRHRTRSSLQSERNLKRKPESEDEPEIDSQGRLVIREGGKPEKEKRSDPDFDARNEASSQMSSKSSLRTQKRRKTSNSAFAHTGREYASKKAGGDLKRKDKLEPYAYWPLDRKMMSCRAEHRAAARKGMASVVKLTKRLEGKSTLSALSVKGVKIKRKQRQANKKATRV